MKIIAVDTGGTFTDFVYSEEGEIKTLKVPSTPQDPSSAVIEGLNQIGGENRRIIHGSTVATNAFLERKGVKTALITNKGFEDIIEIGRQNRERLYDLHYKKPQPIIPRDLRFGIKGRIGPGGEVIEELSPDEVRALAEKLKSLGVEAVAVCLLHSYANPDHEKLVGEILESLLEVHISLSHQVLREFREYERTTTTAINAYLSPKMEGYLRRIKNSLKPGDSLLIMQSNGGIISHTTAGREAVRTILSGPAGGVIGAQFIGKLVKREKLITLDMGGTSTDVSLIEGSPTITTESRIEGIPIKIPMIEINTIGAGGGSIAWIDEGGALRVGPMSAGAVPGPVCYDRGGTEITVTDANLFLGRLLPDHFLGGKMKINPGLIAEPLERISQLLGTNPLETASAVVDTACSNMERALRRVSIQRGYDPYHFTLIAFGGGGPLHACSLAKLLKIQEIIIPPNPGLFSAFGMLCADIVRDYSLTLLKSETKIAPGEIDGIFEELKKLALDDLKKDGISTDSILFESSLDMRFVGQSYELTVPYTQNYRESFISAHLREYQYAHDREVEVVNLRLKAIVPVQKPVMKTVPKSNVPDPDHALISTSQTAFGGEFRKTKVYKREMLKAGNIVEGPAILVEYSSTTVIEPGWEAEVDLHGNLIVKNSL